MSAPQPDPEVCPIANQGRQFGRIQRRFGTITVTSDTTFDITNGDTLYADYWVPDTQKIGESEIPKILNRSNWTEDEINTAVAEMNRNPEQEARNYRDDLRLSAALEREDA